VRASPAAVAEFPFRFNDRVEGESKMSMREALGYLVQLRDLYIWTARAGGRTRPRYQRLTPDDVARLSRPVR